MNAPHATLRDAVDHAARMIEGKAAPPLLPMRFNPHRLDPNSTMNNTTENTRETWYVGISGGGHPRLVAAKKTGRYVATVRDPKDTPLVAAAPDLLDALERIAARADVLQEATGSEDARRIAADARAAIANAQEPTP